MSARVIRVVLMATCGLGIAGMIVTSIADSPGGALTFGLVTAVAAFGMMLVTAVTDGGRAATDEELGEALEARVEELLEAGADERTIRALVRDAMRLGRQTPA